ncbi:Solute carrier family 12 member 8 [Aix galericulata]|nr:Solute carrier family 12 member 8 [Aix galericulata]
MWRLQGSASKGSQEPRKAAVAHGGEAVKSEGRKNECLCILDAKGKTKKEEERKKEKRKIKIKEKLEFQNENKCFGIEQKHGFVGYSEELLFNNTLPDYSQGESFFTVFGVFFPAATGVMAGFNMSGDLQKPATNIPLGSLAAIGTSWFLYMVFVFLLGAICTRQSLRYDFMIAEKVSLVGFLFLLGLYISSLASCMGGLYGAPRILQCIAQENVVPMLAFLGRGKGPNRTPVAAICLTSLITMAFVFIGQVNVLAPIVTINFMLTYIAVDYSYFSISLCYDDQQKAGKTQVENTKPPTSSQPLIFNKPSSHASDGVIQSRSNGTLLEFTKDMDQLFKPFRNEPSASKKGAESLTQKVKQKKVKKPAKQTLQDSFLLDLDHDAPPAQCGWDETAESHHESWQDLTEQGQQLEVGPCWSPAADTQGTTELMGQGEQLRSQAPALCSQKVEEPSVRQQNLELGIQQIPESFYSRFCNHWVSFAGAIVSLIIMFVIQWIYTLVSLGAAVILYFYIGQVSPGLPLGAAANFSLFSWIKSALITSCRRRPSPKEQIVVTPALATVGMETTQLTEENADFASRDRYHQSSLISREEFVNQFQANNTRSQMSSGGAGQQCALYLRAVTSDAGAECPVPAVPPMDATFQPLNYLFLLCNKKLETAEMPLCASCGACSVPLSTGAVQGCAPVLGTLCPTSWSDLLWLWLSRFLRKGTTGDFQLT